MKAHFGEPVSDYENELLTCMIEECAEVIQACTKLQRFGRTHDPRNGLANTVHLSHEIGQLQTVADMALGCGLTDRSEIFAGKERKAEKLVTHMKAFRHRSEAAQ